jgi:exopolyphosphatase/guanosine-5'-triphosphate,3'-diphosphate pyrophosphatase
VASGEEGRAPVIAAIDIGSNSLKLAVARLNASGAIEEFDRTMDTVRLGRGLDASGVLAEDRIEAALASLSQMEARARSQGATRVLAVATEAVRQAENGEAFIARIREETGIEAEIISGEREADLSFSGMAGLTDLSGEVVIGDIGGASTEVILARDGAMQQAHSQPVGSGRLADRHLHDDPPGEQGLAACRDDARTVFGSSPLMPFPDGAGVRLLLAGGTGELLGQLVGTPRWSKAQAEVALAAIADVPSVDLAARLKIQELRARVLPAGIAAALALADLTNPGAIEAARSGIRTGLFMEAFGVNRVASRSSARSTGGGAA